MAHHPHLPLCTGSGKSHEPPSCCCGQAFTLEQPPQRFYFPRYWSSILGSDWETAGLSLFLALGRAIVSSVPTLPLNPTQGSQCTNPTILTTKSFIQLSKELDLTLLLKQSSSRAETAPAAHSAKPRGEQYPGRRALAAEPSHHKPAHAGLQKCSLGLPPLT